MYYQIYCDEGIACQYAGTLKKTFGNTWKVRFKAGFQHYLPDFEGLFEECCSYLRQCFHGHLQPIGKESS